DLIQFCFNIRIHEHNIALTTFFIFFAASTRTAIISSQFLNHLISSKISLRCNNTLILQVFSCGNKILIIYIIVNINDGCCFSLYSFYRTLHEIPCIRQNKWQISKKAPPSLEMLVYKCLKNSRKISAPAIKVPRLDPIFASTITSNTRVTLLCQNPLRLVTSSERVSKSP